MSTQFRKVPYYSSSLSAGQNPENRSTDPTPLKDPSGRIADSEKKGAIAWRPTLVNGLASGALYTTVNYVAHKAMKPSKKDPTAIKAISAGKIIKQGGIQAVASVASGLTTGIVGQYVPTMITKYTGVKPLLTGIYKVGGGYFIDGGSSGWNMLKDFMLSAGSDYGVDWALPTQ